MQQRRKFLVQGLDCAEEIALVRRALEGRPGWQDLDFDLLRSRLALTLDEERLTPAAVIDAIGATGLKASLADSDADNAPAPWRARNGRLAMALASGGALATALLVHWRRSSGIVEVFAGASAPPAAIFWYVLATIAGAWYVAPRAWAALRLARPDMHLLMCAAIAGAMLLGEWFEAATVSFLFTVALLLEQASLRRARRAISDLLDLAPATAGCLNSAGAVEERLVADVTVGTTIVVRPGEKISLDGIVLTGRSHVDESPITGESLPASRGPGEAVYAGTINGEGALEIRTTRPATDTTLARIVHLVEEAQSRRSVRQQWVDRFALVYTPAMMVFAAVIALLPPLLAGGAWPVWIYRGLTVLVIACPCALVISTPVALVSALTAAARRGVLIKGGAALEAAAGLGAVAFDKTGTLTQGRPEVIEIAPLNGHTAHELLERAAAVEQRSTHPLAQAILRRAGAERIEPPSAVDFRELSGRGATGTIGGREFWIGSRRLLLERGVAPAEVAEQARELEALGRSAIAIGNANHVCGLFGVADPPRPEACESIAALKRIGIAHVVILTGDNEPAARAIADAVGADEFEAELLPADKGRAVAGLVERYGSVAMVGDGVNDAPALAQATLGIAMGVAGSDAAIETADVALMSSDLTRLPWLVLHARRTLRIIRQNIAFSLGLKLLFLVLTLAGLSSLWLAIAADTGATLLVIANGLRLRMTSRS